MNFIQTQVKKGSFIFHLLVFPQQLNCHFEGKVAKNKYILFTSSKLLKNKLRKSIIKTLLHSTLTFLDFVKIIVNSNLVFENLQRN